MFDIKSITDAQTADIELKHPVTGALLGASITVAGPENPTRKALDFARLRKLRAEIQETGKHEPSDPEDDVQDAVEKLAACTVGWQGITDGGTPIEFSKQAAAKLYASEGLGWLRDQVFIAMDERSRFIKACAAS
jgi:hypothetical protein